MARLLILAALASLCVNASLAQEARPHGPTDSLPWFKQSFLDLREDVADAADADKQVVLYFHQQRCPYCAKLLRDNFGQREIAQRTQTDFDVIAVNLWGDKEVTDLNGRNVSEKEFARALKVMFTPTLLMLDQEGRVALRINGYYPPHLFTTALDFVAGGHHRELSFRDYVAEREPQPASGELHSELGFLQPPLRLDRRSADDERPLLILFEQRQCRACDELHQQAFQQPETRELLAQLRAAVVDMWSAQPLTTPHGRELPAREWAAELRVSYAPSMVFFATDGEEIFRSEAYLRPFHVSSVLEYVVTGAWREWPEFQRYVQHRADQRREAGETVELW